jgi:hypothetical protein
MKNTLKIAFVAFLTLSLGLNAYFLFLHKNVLKDIKSH